MSNMKCPVCNKGTVDEFKTAPYFACSNEFCPSYSETDTTEYDILIRTRKALDKGMEHITGLNNMIESWYKLINSDLGQETKLQILKSAIKAYCETRKNSNKKD